MNAKIFRSNFLTSILVLVVSFVLIFGILFEYFESRLLSELKNEANYISYAVRSEGADFINNFKDSDKRITLISPDGTVLADTSSSAEGLDNHLKREEIKAAKDSGSGSSSRFSSTLTEKVIYYAVKLDDGSYLRISTTQNSMLTILLGLIQPLIVIVMIIMGISFYLSYKLSKTIVKPINDIDLENPSNNEVYEELTPLLKKISAQKKTIDRQIKEARQKQEEFRLIAENMNEGLLVVDSSGVVLTYNSVATKLLDMEDVSNENILEINRAGDFSDVVKSGLKGKRAESDMDNGDKKYRLIANPVMDGKKIIGAVMMIIDVTESAKREQLRREFTSNVSHELKTPLTSISGFAEMMKDGVTPEETVRDFSSSIYDEAQRLITLVTDIIRISELDEGNIQVVKEAVDLYDLADETINRLKMVADKRGITVRLIGEHVKVQGVRKILDEMVYNLCDNAIKYNKEGGSVEVVVSACDNGKAYFSVRDTGIGIPNSEQGRIFERFYRVDKSHSKKVGGTGLGLSIVKHGAAFHNAEIILESVVDVGTRITLEFQC
ncbi:MAG: PAS domain-containing protein [Clostridia bacterium]|nr:PAS domain-containing protein [Clostridia bacterium]